MSIRHGLPPSEENRMTVLIPKDYFFTGIEQHSSNEVFSIKFYISKDKSKFLIVETENKDEISIGGPFSTRLVEVLQYGLPSLYSYVRFGRP